VTQKLCKQLGHKILFSRSSPHRTPTGGGGEHGRGSDRGGHGGQPDRTLGGERLPMLRRGGRCTLSLSLSLSFPGFGVPISLSSRCELRGAVRSCGVVVLSDKVAAGSGTSRCPTVEVHLDSSCAVWMSRSSNLARVAVLAPMLPDRSFLDLVSEGRSHSFSTLLSGCRLVLAIVGS
jgi:hypothetical protein